MVAMIAAEMRRPVERPAIKGGEHELPERSELRPLPVGEPIPRADHFFRTLDDPGLDAFPAMVDGAVKLQVLGRTAVNLLNQYERIFERLIREGCELQFLFVDPQSEATTYIYGNSSEAFHTNFAASISHLHHLMNLPGANIHVRVTSHAPTSSLFIVNKKDDQRSFIRVQLYFLHSAFGRDRPIFRISRDDKWYSVFREEFVELWDNGKPYEFTDKR